MKLPVNAAFRNPWCENGATSNMSCFPVSCSIEDEAVWEEGAGADEADDELENEFDTDSEQED